MSTGTKQSVSGSICLVFAILMMLCIWKMIPYGLAGEIAKVKSYFIFMIFAFVISLSAGVAYYYYRNKINNDSKLGQIRAEVAALSQAGQKPTETPGDVRQEQSRNK